MLSRVQFGFRRYVLGNYGSRSYTGVLLLNTGEPEGSSEMLPYFEAVFNDKTNTKFNLLPYRKLACYSRYLLETYSYSKVGYSNMKTSTAVQAKALECFLNKTFSHIDGFKVFPAFRYSGPSFENVINSAVENYGIQKFIAMPQVLFYNMTELKSIENEIHRIKASRSDVSIALISKFGSNKSFRQCMVDLITGEMNKFEQENKLLIFCPSARLLNCCLYDDYICEIGQCVASVMAKLDYKYDHEIAWLHKSVLRKWFGPSIVQTLNGVCSNGTMYDAVLIVPFGYTTDSIEVKYILDTKILPYIQNKFSNFEIRRAPTVGHREHYMESLSAAIRKHILLRHH